MPTFSIDEAYKQPPKAPQKPAAFSVDDAYGAPERDPLWAQFGGKVIEGALGLPGLPVDAGVALGNFVARNTGREERPIEGSELEAWGSQGWSDANKARMTDPFTGRKLSEALNIPAPVNDAERVAQKGGLFFGSGAVAGPAAMIPAATAMAGSETGRIADQLVPDVTKGYGEFAGGVAGGFVPVARRLLSRPVDTSPAPSNESLRAQAEAAYQRADDAGIILKPEALQRMNADLQRELTEFGYHPKLQPGAATAIDELNAAAEKGNITLKGVDQLRKIAKNAAGNTNRADMKATQKVVKNIDKMLSNLTPDDVLTGDATKGVAALNEARSLWSRLSKSEIVDAALDKAVRQTQRANSGGNIDNAIRQQFDRILNSSKARGFTPDEIALMRRVVGGRGPTQEILRWAGKMSPRSGGLISLLLAGGAGASIANPAVAPLVLGPAIAGSIARPIADAMTKGNARMLSSAVRRGNAFKPRRMLTSAAPALAAPVGQR